MEKEEFFKFFKKVPKAELHLHLEAVASRKTVRKLMQRKDPNKDEGILYEESQKMYEYTDLAGLKKMYSFVQGLYDSVADFDLVFNDLKDYIIRNGITYVELFAAPSAFILKGWNFSDLVDCYRRNILKLKAETGVNVRMLIDVSRSNGVESAEKNIQLLLAYRIPEIIGIALGGSEEKGPAKMFKGVFAKARANGLKTEAHSGEDMGPMSIWETLFNLQPDRIGQGISAIGDPKLVKELAGRKLPLEICPTSNVFSGKYASSFEEHPARKLFKQGVTLTIGTDDPLFLNTELMDEYWIAHEKMGFKLDELKQLVKNSFTMSFLSNLEKSVYADSVETAWRK